MSLRCQHCNHEYLAGHKFCPECGQATLASEQSSLEHDEVSLGAVRTMVGGVVANHGEADEEGEESVSLDGLVTMAGVAAGGESQVKGAGGERLDERYEILKEVGRGGFAKVWKARDRKLGRIVAVKRLLSSALQGESGEQTLERFRREAQAIAQRQGSQPYSRYFRLRQGTL